MSDDMKCPRCGAERATLPEPIVSSSWTDYACGSTDYGAGGFVQSMGCELRELRRRVRELEEVAAEVASMPGCDWLNGQLRLAEVLTNNQQARAAGGEE